MQEKFPALVKDKQWATPETVEDPETLPNVKGWNILIRPYKGPEKVGSLYLPDSTRDDVEFLSNVGQVKAIGSEAWSGREPWCEVGDWVVWGRHQGVRLRYDGVTFVLLQDELVLFVVDDPKKISIENNLAKF